MRMKLLNLKLQLGVVTQDQVNQLLGPSDPVDILARKILIKLNNKYKSMLQIEYLSLANHLSSKAGQDFSHAPALECAMLAHLIYSQKKKRPPVLPPIIATLYETLKEKLVLIKELQDKVKVAEKKSADAVAATTSVSEGDKLQAVTSRLELELKQAQESIDTLEEIRIQQDDEFSIRQENLEKEHMTDLAEFRNKQNDLEQERDQLSATAKKNKATHATEVSALHAQVVQLKATIANSAKAVNTVPRRSATNVLIVQTGGTRKKWVKLLVQHVPLVGHNPMLFKLHALAVLLVNLRLVPATMSVEFAHRVNTVRRLETRISALLARSDIFLKHR
jgi:hypothetical protein